MPNSSDSSKTLASADVGNINIDTLVETLSWHQKFYGLEVPLDLLKQQIELASTAVQSQEPSIKNTEKKSSDLSSAPAAPVKFLQPKNEVTQEKTKIIFVVKIEELSAEFWMSAEGEFLKAIINKGLSLDLAAVEVLSEPKFLSYSFATRNCRIIMFGLSPQPQVELALQQQASKNKLMNWLNCAYGQIVYVPALEEIANNQTVKKQFWDLLRPLRNEK